MTSEQKFMRAAVVAFLLLAATFFFVKGWFVAVPTLFAAMATAANAQRGGYAIPLALLFSAAGDYAGSEGSFLFQVGFFAVGHLCFIADFFACRKPTRKKGIWAAVLAVVTVVYLSVVLSYIVSEAEYVAVTVYAMIIYSMGATAILQQRKRYGWYVVAAVLFILSDSLIVFDKYIAQIPARSVWIMTTYYAAQGLFMTMHLMRGARKE